MDFNSLSGDTVALNKLVTIGDLKHQGIQLEEGLILNVYENDPSEEHPKDKLIAQGHAHYEKQTEKWVLVLTSKIVRITENQREAQELKRVIRYVLREF